MDAFRTRRAGYAARPEAAAWKTCLELRKLLGLERSNGNRALATGIAELCETRVFEHIEFMHGNESLSWKLTDEVGDYLFSEHVYGLFDIRCVSHLRSPLDILVYSEIGLIRRMRAPRITLLLGGIATCLKRDAEWQRLRPDVIRALQISAALYDVGFIVLPGRDGTRRGISSLEVRIVKQGQTGWSWKGMTAAPADMAVRKVLLIRASAVGEVAVREAATAAKEFFPLGAQSAANRPVLPHRGAADRAGERS